MSGPLRVAFVIDTLRPGAGTENQLILLLRRFDRRSVDPVVVCLRGHPDIERLDVGCPVRVIDLERLGSLDGARKLRELARWFRRQRIELVLTFFRDANIVGTLAGRLAGATVIGNRRSLSYWHRRWDPWILRALRPLTAAWIANSEAARRQAIELEGLAPDRVRVIVNAIDTERFRPRSTDGPVPRTGDDVRYVCVANLRPVKQHALLIEAFARSLDRIGPATLLLVGEGEERSRLERLAASLDVTDRVRFLGSRDDVPRVLADSDVGVLASSSESSSNALLEYLACGLPVVATDVGGSGELIERGVHGWLIRPGDVEDLSAALVAAGRDAGRRGSMARAARALVERRHAPEVVVSAWQRAFDELAGRPAPSAGAQR